MMVYFEYLIGNIQHLLLRQPGESASDTSRRVVIENHAQATCSKTSATDHRCDI